MFVEHADIIAEVFKQACLDALNAHRRDDYAARQRFHDVCDALEAAYPREVRAVIIAAHGQTVSGETK